MLRIGADHVGGGTGDGLAGTGGHGVDDAVGGGVHDRHGLAQGGVAQRLAHDAEIDAPDLIGDAHHVVAGDDLGACGNKGGAGRLAGRGGGGLNRDGGGATHGDPTQARRIVPVQTRLTRLGLKGAGWYAGQPLLWAKLGLTATMLVAVLRALGRQDWLNTIAPVATINPLALTREAQPRQRASRTRRAPSAG